MKKLLNKKTGIISVALASLLTTTSFGAIETVFTGGVFSILQGVDGSLWAWGSNNYGELGDGTSTEKHSPVEVNISRATGFPVNLNITSLHTGRYFTIAKEANGSLWAWGANGFG